MFLEVWKNYRDYRFQNPVCFEQAISLNYKYILYDNILINRKYEEEVICLTVGLFNEHTEELNSIIQQLNNELDNNAQYYDIAKKNREMDFNRYVLRRLKFANRIGAITTESYLKPDSDKLIERLLSLNHDKHTITSDYTIASDTHKTPEQILMDKTIELYLISNQCLDDFKGQINWSKTIIV